MGNLRRTMSLGRLARKKGYRKKGEVDPDETPFDAPDRTPYSGTPASGTPYSGTPERTPYGTPTSDKRADVLMSRTLDRWSKHKMGGKDK